MSLDDLGINFSVLVGGLIGGLVSVVTAEKTSLLNRLMMVLVGCSTAIYVQPILEHYFSISPTLAPGIGFLLSLTSMKLIKNLTTAVEHLDLNSYFKNKLKIKK